MLQSDRARGDGKSDQWTWVDGLGLGLLAILAALVFGQTLGFAFVPYDDPVMVTANGYVRGGFSMSGMRWALFYAEGGQDVAHAGVTNLWHPLTWMSHMMDATLFGVERAAGHHGVSVLLHILSGFFVYAIGKRLGLSPLGSWVVAALFLVHPLHVEPVAWVSSRKEVLCGLLVHLALWLGLTGRMRWAIGVFAAALLAKPLAVVAPLLLLLLWAWPRDGEKRGLSWWREKCLSLWPWFAMAAAGAGAALYFQGMGSHAAFMDALPWDRRLLAMASGYLFLLGRSVWPVDLAFHYPWPAFGVAAHLAAWGIVSVVAALLFLLRSRFPKLIWAFVWFTVCWLPISGLAYVGTSFTADRYAYLGLSGFFLVFGHAVSRASGVRQGKHWLRWGFALALILVAAGAAWKQTGVWRDGWSLFRHAAKAQPRDSVALSNLAGMMQQDKRHAEALDLYRQARALGGSQHLAWFNEGNCHRELGQLADAEAAYRESVAAFPGFAMGWKNLGLLLAMPGHPGQDVSASRDAFAKAWETSGNRDPVALMLLIETHLALGEQTEAATLLPELRQLAPRDPRIQERLRQWETSMPH